MDTLGIEPRAFCMRSGCTHPSNGHTSPTLRKWARDDLEHFFEQEHLSRIGVEKPPKSSRPAFSRVYCPPGPCANSGTDRQDTRPTNSTAETLSVEGAGGRKKSFSSQLTCSMLCMDTLGIEPRAFCVRCGCTHPSNGQTSPTLRKWGRDDLAHGHTGDWAQGLLHAKRMYTSQQWPHESYTEKMGAGWFRAFFWTRTSQ